MARSQSLELNQLIEYFAMQSWDRAGQGIYRDVQTENLVEATLPSTPVDETNSARFPYSQLRRHCLSRCVYVLAFIYIQ